MSNDSGRDAAHHEAPATNPVAALPATLVLGLGTLITHGFGLALVPAMLPRIADDLDVGYGVLGAAVATGLVAYSLGALITSRLLERVPNRGALIGSYALSAVGLLVAGAATSTAALTLAVVVLGLVAPVSWALTLHVAAATTAHSSRGAVMASASGGAALGVLINGVLVQTSDSVHSWRVSFVIAAAIAALPVIAGLLVYRHPVAAPSAGSGPRARFRAVLTTRAGRVVLVASLTAGLAGFPFSTFLTATAIDEMEVSALAAAAVWWLIGMVGLASGPILGRYGDRTSPLQALLVGITLYAGGLLFLVVAWGYLGLLVAAVGYSFMNYPIWGLVGAAANRRFEPALAVRSISLGLIGAALGGAVANATIGPWIEATASFRGPVVAMGLVVVGVAAWYLKIARSGGLERAGPHPSPSSRVG